MCFVAWLRRVEHEALVGMTERGLRSPDAIKAFLIPFDDVHEAQPNL
jgi:hypothetical protein